MRAVLVLTLLALLCLGALSMAPNRWRNTGNSQLDCWNLQPPGGMLAMYHYTSKKGKDGILRSGHIRQSVEGVNGGHARYGPGVYLTNLSPRYGRKRIVQTCWSPRTWPSNSYRVDYVFCFLFPHYKVEEVMGKPHVYRYEGNLNLHDYSWGYGLGPGHP